MSTLLTYEIERERKTNSRAAEEETRATSVFQFRFEGHRRTCFAISSIANELNRTILLYWWYVVMKRMLVLSGVVEKVQ